MQRYFFELQDRNSRLHDPEGEEFKSPADAEMHARQIAYELARNHPPASLIDSFVVLLDGEGRELIAIPLQEIIESAASPPKTRQLVH